MFSIIVPVYNREKYLQKCIDSLVGQTFKDIEIILVNDCSPDNSLHIIEENMKRDSRIKLVNHQVNKGTFQARQSGFLASTHDYILFVDSDDYLDLDCCEKLANILSKKHYDIIQFCGIHKFENKPDAKVHNFEALTEGCKYFDDEVFEQVIVKNKIGIWETCIKSLYRPLVKKSFDFIGEEELVWSEDFLQSFIMMYYAKSIIFDNSAVYYYVQHENNSYKKMTADKYWNAYFPNHLRVNNLLQSFIKQEGIDKKYPVINSIKLVNDIFKYFTEEALISEYNSHQHNMFAMYKDEKKIILYIFFIKISIKLKNKKK